MKNKLLAVLFGATLVLGACGGDKNKDNNENASGGDTGTDTASVDAESIISKNCIVCHGGNLEGQGNAPALANIGSELDVDKIHDIVTNGQKGMPPFKGTLSDEEITAVSEYLAAKK